MVEVPAMIMKEPSSRERRGDARAVLGELGVSVTGPC